MKIQLFQISLATDQIIYDQNSLNDFLSTVDFVKSDAHFVDSKQAYWSVLVHYEEPVLTASVKPKPKVSSNSEVELNEEQQALFLELKDWRNQKARELNLSPFLVCYNRELAEIAIMTPESVDNLRLIKGFGEVKTQKYATEILEIIKGFRQSVQS